MTESGSTRTFTYDSDGNVAGRGTDTLTWDGWGRHTGGTFSGQSVWYGFDPVGFRRSRAASGTTTRYLHGGLFETDTIGTIILTDVDGPAGDLAHYAGPPTTSMTVSYLYYNGHGDLAATADTTGTRTNAYTHDAYGALRTGTGGAGTSERWIGRWDKKLDTTSGLIEMGARPYDPGLGRFLAVDPIEGGALNAYDYAYQNPINLYDLDGRRVDPGGGARACGRNAVRFAGFGCARINAMVMPWGPGNLARVRQVPQAAKNLLGKARSVVQRVEHGLFERHKIGRLNRNDYLRFGYSWKGTAQIGREVFRIAIGSRGGSIRIRGKNIHIHLTLFPRR